VGDAAVTSGLSAERAVRGAVVVACAAFALWLHTAASIGFQGGLHPTTLRDFGAFWAAGDAANAGRDPYQTTALARAVVAPGGTERATNLNPPVSVLAFQLLARVPPAVAFRAWQVGSALGYVGMVAGLTLGARPHAWGRALLVLLWEPFWSTVDLGQIYVGLAVAVLVATALLRRNPAVAGLVIGAVVALKPQFVLWPLFLLAARQRRPAVAGAISAAALSLLPVVFGHVDWYVGWWHAIARWRFLAFSDNLSLVSILARAGVPDGLAAVATAGVVGTLVAFARHRRIDSQRASTVGLVAAILAGPVSWVGYATVLAPDVLIQPKWSEATLVAAALLAIPGALIWWSDQAGFLAYDVALAHLLLGSFQRPPDAFEGPVGKVERAAHQRLPPGALAEN